MSGLPNLPDSISLIGMPGTGKSTVGVLLAKVCGLGFVDTDLEIQRQQQASLQEILEARGHQYLREVEQQVITRLAPAGLVVATGGSAVYAAVAMAHLSAAGPLVYLRTGLTVLEQRVSDQPRRGIASPPDWSLEQVFAERTPLYERYADLVVDTDTLSPAQLSTRIARELGA